MALNGGSLDTALWNHAAPNQVGLVLVDEHEGSHAGQGDNATAYNQQVTLDQTRLLRVAGQRGCPVFMCTFEYLNAYAQAPDRGAWALTLRAYVPNTAWMFVKTEANAFKGTDLQTRLQNAGVQTLIVLGYHRDACCKQTVFGGLFPGMNDNPNRGAVDFGYTVWSSRAVLRAGGPNEAMPDYVQGLWQNTAGVTLYAS